MAKFIILCVVVLSVCIWLLKMNRKKKERSDILQRLTPWAESLKKMDEDELRDEYRKIRKEMLEVKERQEELDVRFEIIKKEQDFRWGNFSARRKRIHFEKDWRRLSI